MKTLTLPIADLLKPGLVPTFNPKNRPGLITAVGAVSYEGVLMAVRQFDQVDTSALTDYEFPYPQLFIYEDATVLVCTATEIYELVNGSLVQKLTGISPGVTWSTDYRLGTMYKYLTNATVAVTRDPISGVYAVDSTVPYGMSVCNFKGQVLIGSPNTPFGVCGYTAPLSWDSNTIALTVTPKGTWTGGEDVHIYDHWWWQQSIDIDDGRVLFIPQFYEYDGGDDPDSGFVAAIYDVADSTWEWQAEVTGKYPSYGQPNSARLAATFGAFWAEFSTVEPPASVQTLTLYVLEGGTAMAYDRVTWAAGTNTYARDNTFDKMDVADSGLIACAFFALKEGGLDKNCWAIDSTPDKGATWNSRYYFPIVSDINGYQRASLRIDEDGTIWFAYSAKTDTYASELYVYKSTDGGQTFTLISTKSFPSHYITDLFYSVDATGQYQYYSVKLKNSGNVISGQIYNSTDSGATFNVANTYDPATESPIIIGDTEHIIIPTYSPDGFKVSDDYGLTFAQIPGVAPMQNLYVDHQSDGPELVYSECSATFNGTNYLGMLYSNNYGQTWTVIPSPFSNEDVTQVIAG